MRFVAVLTLLLAVAGCIEVPELDQTITEEAKRAPYPNLVPVEPIRAAVPKPQIGPGLAPSLDARADALKNKADSLKNSPEVDLAARADALQRRADTLNQEPVIDAATKARMERGVKAPDSAAE